MKSKSTAGWSEDEIKRVIDHNEMPSEDDAVARDESALSVEETLPQIPVVLLAKV